METKLNLKSGIDKEQTGACESVCVDLNLLLGVYREVDLELFLDAILKVLQVLLVESDLEGIADQVDHAAEGLHIDQIIFKVPDVLPNSLVLLCLEEALLTKACLDFISSILNYFMKGLEIAQSYLELLVTYKIGV